MVCKMNPKKKMFVDATLGQWEGYVKMYLHYP